MKSQIFLGKNVKTIFFTFFSKKGQEGAPEVVLGAQGRSKSGAGRPAPLFWPRDITESKGKFSSNTLYMVKFYIVTDAS